MNEPINAAIPNTVIEKMKAIVAISRAIENISKVLISVQVDSAISNNIIDGAEMGINVFTDDKL